MTSLVHGWLPATVQILAAVALITAIGWRTRRWRLVWIPWSALIGVFLAVATYSYIESAGSPDDCNPAPHLLWVSAALMLNLWVGYVPTVQAAWNQVTAGPLPDETDQVAIAVMQREHTMPIKGSLVAVDIPSTALGSKHRQEFVYLPPAWFAEASAPSLPALMMIGGEFDTAADWMRAGGAVKRLDDFDQGVAGWFAVNSAVGGGKPNDQAIAATSLCGLGDHVGIDCAVVSQPGNHDWPFASNAFTSALPWLAGKIGTPGVPQVGLPGSIRG